MRICDTSFELLNGNYRTEHMTTFGIRIGRLAGLMGLVGVTSLAMARGAEARFHLHLRGSTPADGATISSAPANIQLFFSEKPEIKVTTVNLVDGGNANVALSAPRLASGADTAVVVDVKAPLAAGAYTVKWSAMASDGHVQRGSFGFIVAGGKP
jgi:methionine-rich copper-binding protein CopC